MKVKVKGGGRRGGRAKEGVVHCTTAAIYRGGGVRGRGLRARVKVRARELGLGLGAGSRGGPRRALG